MSASLAVGTPLRPGPNTLISTNTPTRHRPVSSSPRGRRDLSTIQCVSVSDMTPDTAVSDFPVKEIPGTYGLPFFGAIKDRLDFHWFQQVPNFYEARRDKYKSTVFRTNVPPGPPFYPDPRVITVVDEKSFPILFDVSKVEKKDVFTGTYVPSLKLTGGYRVLPYLDPSEPKHEQLKNFAFEILKNAGPRILPQISSVSEEIFASWEASLKKDGKVAYVNQLDLGTFKFMMTAFTKQNPYAEVENRIGESGPIDSLLWVASQIGPITVTALPWYLLPFLAPLIELFLHTLPIPAFLVKAPYKKLENYFRAYGTELLDIAEKQLKLDREEALHNLLFICVFNAWGGVKLFFPTLLKRLGATSADYQKELAAEVRKAVKDNGGELNLKAVAAMPLAQSAVYEALRIDPPVPFQYAKAKEDLVIKSHDASFQIKKGETIHGYMPVTTKDPKVFDDPFSFLPKRFVGEEGRALLKYVLWSNGPQTEKPSVSNKHCPGKDFILTIAPAFVASIYLKYETIVIDPNTGSLTALKPSTS